jgi:hypothetical protein
LIYSPLRASLEATHGVPDRASLHQPEIAALGKTLPPFSQRIAYARRRWAPFKRALPTEEQAILDRLLDGAKRDIQAGVMVSRPWPFETMVMAVLLAHEKRLEHLMRQIEPHGPSAESWPSEKKESPRHHGPGHE